MTKKKKKARSDRGRSPAPRDGGYIYVYIYIFTYIYVYIHMLLLPDAPRSGMGACLCPYTYAFRTTLHTSRARVGRAFTAAGEPRSAMVDARCRVEVWASTAPRSACVGVAVERYELRV